MEAQPETPAQSPIEIILNKAIDTFTDSFSPALTFEQSDEQLSTAEIADRLLDYMEEEDIDKTIISKILKEKGFVLKYNDGFVWLLKYTS